MIKPLLQPSDTIGVFSPSSALGSLEELKPATRIFESFGYKVYIHPQTGAKNHQIAGTSKEKVGAFHSLLKNPEINVIWAARGGNGASKFLDLIDFDLWKKYPKPLIGYSDTTALHCAGLSQANIQNIQGPMFREIGHSLDVKQFEYLMALLNGKDIEFPTNDCAMIKEGKASGKLIGGTLFLIQSMLGTKYMPDIKGAILYLEDIGEELSRIDRALQHLKMALPFDQLGGIMFGDFIEMKDTGTPYGFTLDDIIHEHAKDLDIPIIKNLPFGHGKNMFALPFGYKGELSVSSGQISLKLDCS